ncbi:MAG: FN3 associated domain-containing protein [Fibrobacterota bacterium]
MKKSILCTLLLLNTLWAQLIVHQLEVVPEFIRPGEPFSVKVLAEKPAKGNFDPTPRVEFAGVFSTDDNWSDDDFLFMYNGAQDTEPLQSVDNSKDVWSPATIYALGTYTFTTNIPASYGAYDEFYIIVRGKQNSKPTWEGDKRPVGEMTDYSQMAIKVEVAGNKYRAYNTAYMQGGKVSKDGVTIIDAKPRLTFTATPSDDPEYVFSSTTLDVDVEVSGNKADQTTVNYRVISNNDQDTVTGSFPGTQGTVTIDTTSRLEAWVDDGVYWSYSSASWEYVQDLPDGRIIAVPSVDTPGVYTYSSVTQAVDLALETEAGETLYPSDSLEIYYTLGNEEPVIGDANTTVYDTAQPVSIDDDDTLRAIARSKYYDSPAEGIWYYDRTLPEAKLTATPGNDDVYVYDTPSIDVTLATNEGNQIYYTLDGSQPTPSAKTFAGHEGEVTIFGDDTLRALATGPAYRDRDSLWIYDSELPPLYLEADAGSEDGDTVNFHFDTTVNLRAVDSAGKEVADARIFYRVDTTVTGGIDSLQGDLYSSSFTVDTTVTVQAAAYHPKYQGTSGEWYYRLLLRENSLTAQTFDTSWKSGDLIAGDVLKSSGDTAYFGHTLQIFLTADADSIRYEKDGQKRFHATEDTIYLDDSDPDTTVIPVEAFSHGYEHLSRDLVFVRDTVAELVVDPEGKKFTRGPLPIFLSLTEEWRNSGIHFDTSGSFEEYTQFIQIDTTTTLRVWANADFAVETDTIMEEYILVLGAESAACFDGNGDGAIDSVRIRTNLTVPNLPDSVQIEDPFSDAVYTAVQEDMTRIGDQEIGISFTDPFIFTGRTGFDSTAGRFFGDEYAGEAFLCADSVAPVLLSGAYYPGEIVGVDPVERADDSLRLVYSERVSLERDDLSPVRVFAESGAPYTLQVDAADLSTVDTMLGDRVSTVSSAWFTVAGNTGPARYPQNGDSVNISLESKTADDGGARQDISENRRAPLFVGDIPYRLLVQAVSPENPATFTVPDELRIDRIGTEGLIIVADFLMRMEDNNQDASVRILDNVGNVVATCSGRDDASENLGVALRENETSKLVMQWNGTNEAGRPVAAGSYLAVITIRDGRGNTFPYKITLAVQRPVP